MLNANRKAISHYWPCFKIYNIQKILSHRTLWIMHFLTTLFLIFIGFPALHWVCTSLLLPLLRGIFLYSLPSFSPLPFIGACVCFSTVPFSLTAWCLSVVLIKMKIIKMWHLISRRTFQGFITFFCDLILSSINKSLCRVPAWTECSLLIGNHSLVAAIAMKRKWCHLINMYFIKYKHPDVCVPSNFQERKRRQTCFKILVF